MKQRSKELGKRYLKDEVVLIGSISKHCHVWGAEKKRKKPFDAVLVPALLLWIHGCMATGTL